MKLVVVSPPDDRTRETAIVHALFEAGLERYHLRKPSWPAERSEEFLTSLLPQWRSRVVAHDHHAVAQRLGAGIHFRDDGSAPANPDLSATFASRSSHDVATVSAALGHYNAVFIAPIFASVSKPGHGPMPKSQLNELRALLASRTSDQHRTQVIALGGITADTLADCLTFGFDGVAVLGAVWDAEDPVAAYVSLKQASNQASKQASSSQTAPRIERTTSP